MGLRINTNVASLTAQRSLGQVTEKQNTTLNKLSSGTRINRAADDAAGLAISEKLKASIKGINQANRNANDGISLIQTAEGGLNEISNILVRLRELSVQAASDTVGDPERNFTDIEYQNLKSEIQRISQVTEFNGKKLLNGTGMTYDFQIGINNNQFEDRISYNAATTNSTLESLGVNELSVQTKEGSQTSLSFIDEAIKRISGQRADLGAVQNRLVSTSTNLQGMSENLSAANSRIRDTDFASETAENVRLNILSQAGTAVLAQANTGQGQAAMKLLS
ncbi:MAG: flagellin FliC [Oligoflexia bacterium]|nr:flagellin FliC [Oligoflexia bacterium]